MKYCDQCHVSTQWVTVEQAAETVQRSERTIYYWIAFGFVHVRILPCGRGKRLCEESLLRKGEAFPHTRPA